MTVKQCLSVYDNLMMDGKEGKSTDARNDEIRILDAGKERGAGTGESINRQTPQRDRPPGSQETVGWKMTVDERLECLRQSTESLHVSCNVLHASVARQSAQIMEYIRQMKEMLEATGKLISAKWPKPKDPAAVALGRKGGMKKVPKGLARISPAKRKKIQSAGGKAAAAARWEKKTKC